MVLVQDMIQSTIEWRLQNNAADVLPRWDKARWACNQEALREQTEERM